jgi:hypothetical protein
MKYLAGVITVILCCAAVHPKSPLVKRSQCGGNGLPALKTWSDPQRFKVNARIRNAYIPYINAIKPPVVQPRTRKSGWQKRVWVVKAQIVEYRLDHGELRMVLYWDNAYISGVIPSPTCLNSKTRQRARIEGAWNFFINRCAIPSPLEWRPLGAVVFISGVGFWANKNLHRRGQAPNGAELHPITGIQVLAGCGT